jgi:hypothetical protein
VRQLSCKRASRAGSCTTAASRQLTQNAQQTTLFLFEKHSNRKVRIHVTQGSVPAFAERSSREHIIACCGVNHLRLTTYDLRLTTCDLRLATYNLRLTTYDNHTFTTNTYDLALTHSTLDLSLKTYDLRVTTYAYSDADSLTRLNSVKVNCIREHLRNEVS